MAFFLKCTLRAVHLFPCRYFALRRCHFIYVQFLVNVMLVFAQKIRHCFTYIKMADDKEFLSNFGFYVFTFLCYEIIEKYKNKITHVLFVVFFLQFFSVH